MAAPTVQSVTNGPSMPKIDAYTRTDWDLVPAAGASSLVSAVMVNNGGDYVASDQYGGVAMSNTGGAYTTSYSNNVLAYMVDISARGSDQRSHWRQWNQHVVYDVLIEGATAFVDQDRHLFTDWSYTGMNPVVLDPAGQDCLAIIFAVVDESDVARIQDVSPSNGATATQHRASSARGAHRLWSVPVAASDGPVSFVIPVSGQAILNGLLLAGSGNAKRLKQALMLGV